MQKLIQCNRRLRRLGTNALLLGVLLGAHPVMASAQSLLDPRTAEFNSSPDHYGTGTDSLPIVDRYDLSIFEAGTGTPLTVVNIGKPSPDGTGVIHVDLVSALPSWPPPSGVTYEARVNAIGPSGSSPSGISNSFAFSGPCGYALSTTSATFAAAGGDASIAVTTGTSCDWTASNATAWITLNSGGGAGSKTVGFTVAPNTSGAARTGSFTLADTLVTIAQDAPCAFNVSSGAVSFLSDGGSGTVAVDAAAGCSWAGGSSTSWITVTPAGTPTGLFAGTRTVAYSIAPNTATSARTGVFTVAGTVLTVSQAGLSCAPTVVAGLTSLPAAGGSSTANVTTPAGCNWAGGSSTSWITVSPAGTPTGLFDGTKTVTYTIAPNTAAAARTGVFTVAGTVISVSQAAALSCAATVIPGVTSLTADGGSSTANVTAPAGCSWAGGSSTSWITVSPAGTPTGLFDGTKTVTYTIAPNTTAAARTGVFTVAGTVLTVSQAGFSCAATVVPGVTSLTAAGGSATANVTAAAGCSWAGGSSTSWITVSPAGTPTGLFDGTKTVTYTIAPNTSTAARTGVFTVAGTVISVSQAAALSCSATVVSGPTSVTAAGGSATANVTATAGCNWAGGSSTSWIKVSPAGTPTGLFSGTQTVTYTIAPNTSTSARTGVFTVAGKVITLSQSASN